MRASFDEQFVRLPKSAEEARTQVNDLKQRGVDGIKAVLEGGGGSASLQSHGSLDFASHFRCRACRLSSPSVTHTGNAQDVADALDAGVDGIEHGSMRDRIPEGTVRQDESDGCDLRSDALGDGSHAGVRRWPGRLLDRPWCSKSSRDNFRASKRQPQFPRHASRAQTIGAYPFRLDLAKQNLAMRPIAPG